MTLLDIIWTRPVNSGPLIVFRTGSLKNFTPHRTIQQHSPGALSPRPWCWCRRGLCGSQWLYTQCTHTLHTVDSRSGLSPGAPGTSTGKCLPWEEPECDSGKPWIPGENAGALYTWRLRTPDRSSLQTGTQFWDNNGRGQGQRSCSLVWRRCQPRLGILW